jgi:hypothetical protein
MSIWNSFMADTVGVIYSARTGNVDPWTVADFKDQCAVGIRKAMPGAAEASIQAAILECQKSVDATLRSNPGGSAAPGDCQFRIPYFGCIAGADSAEGLNKLKNAVDILVFVVVAAVIYVVVKKVGLWGDLVKAFK